MTRPRYNQKRKRKKGKFLSGYYKPINEDKYRQPIDRTMNKDLYPNYRSSWELAFYKYLDHSDKVEYWGTEVFFIPYISPKDNQIHRYFSDVMMKTKDGSTFVIEIKPKSQVNTPINQAKFKAAEEYCKRNNSQFLILTEVELKQWGII